MTVSRVFIIANGMKEESRELSERIINYLESHGIEGHVVSTHSNEDELSVPMNTDLVITLGGDGTVLYAARAVNEMGIPILPVNLGTFGYITEVGKDEWQEALEYFISNGSNISRRLMLRITVHRNGKRVWQGSALNEAVITSAGIAKVISLNLALDKTPAGSFRADGMIIATPTGSTAYSMSAGGSVIDPRLKCICVTPICPQALGAKPLVFAPDSRLTLTAESPECMLTVDGGEPLTLKSGSEAEVFRSRRSLRMIKLKEDGFYEVLRKKSQM